MCVCQTAKNGPFLKKRVSEIQNPVQKRGGGHFSEKIANPLNWASDQRPFQLIECLGQSAKKG
jgi:hypothetical protein